MRSLLLSFVFLLSTSLFAGNNYSYDFTSHFKNIKSSPVRTIVEFDEDGKNTFCTFKFYFQGPASLTIPTPSPADLHTLLGTEVTIKVGEAEQVIHMPGMDEMFMSSKSAPSEDLKTRNSVIELALRIPYEPLRAAGYKAWHAAGQLGDFNIYTEKAVEAFMKTVSQILKKEHEEQII